MPDELLTNINKQVKDVDSAIAEGKDYIKLLKEVGEDTTEFDTRFRTLEKKANKFKQALKTRGYE